MTLGTVSDELLLGPRETLIWTCPWNGTVVPAGFACCTTLPNCSDDGTKARLARMPALPSSVSAAASFWPFTSGTVAFCGCGGGGGVAAVVVVLCDVVVVA